MSSPQQGRVCTYSFSVEKTGLRDSISTSALETKILWSLLCNKGLKSEMGQLCDRLLSVVSRLMTRGHDKDNRPLFCDTE